MTARVRPRPQQWSVSRHSECRLPYLGALRDRGVGAHIRLDLHESVEVRSSAEHGHGSSDRDDGHNDDDGRQAEVPTNQRSDHDGADGERGGQRATNAPRAAVYKSSMRPLPVRASIATCSQRLRLRAASASPVTNVIATNPPT